MSEKKIGDLSFRWKISIITFPATEHITEYNILRFYSIYHFLQRVKTRFFSFNCCIYFLNVINILVSYRMYTIDHLYYLFPFLCPSLCSLSSHPRSYFLNIYSRVFYSCIINIIFTFLKLYNYCD